MERIHEVKTSQGSTLMLGEYQDIKEIADQRGGTIKVMK